MCKTAQDTEGSGIKKKKKMTGQSSPLMVHNSETNKIKKRELQTEIHIKREILKNGNVTPSGCVEGILDRKKAA